MPTPVLLLAGIFVLAMAGLGLVRGKVAAGACGLKTNYCHRAEQPLLYWGFVFIYLAIGLFLVFQAL